MEVGGLMLTAALLFASTFAVVFALGLQSLNVNGGHRLLAFVTSFAIGGSNLVLFKVLPGPTDGLQIAAYLLGGPFGILASMWVHPHLVQALARRRAARAVRIAANFTPPAELLPGPGLGPPQGPTFAAARALCRDLLDPDALGHAATPEIRNRAREVLGITRKEPMR
jgi:hypothetical protein